MFADAQLRTKLGRLFSADTDRFDELIASVGLDPKRDLVGADLRGANFAGSVINEWDLSRCDLTGASVSGARIRNLITTDAIGLDLTGAEPLEETTEGAPSSAGDLNWLIDKVTKSTKAETRGPFLRQLLDLHREDSRTWAFLLEHHLKRERVGKYVSFIITEWDARRGPSEVSGNDLMLKLLQPSGSPYITVRARLLRELASRLGPNDRIFEIAKEMVRQEGFWTSGITAMSVLAKVFPGQSRAAELLKQVVSELGWFGSKGDAVSALLDGFDTPDTLKFVETLILDASQQNYFRSSMLKSYCRHGRKNPDTWRLAVQLFDTDPEAEIRAAVIEARSRYGDLSGPHASEALQGIARGDRDPQVRGAALHALRPLGKKQIDFLLQRGIEDGDGSVRSMAIRLAASLGHDDQKWFARIFAQDPSDAARSAALDWLLSNDKSMSDDDLHMLLVKEIEQGSPGFAAGRSAYEALNRWPTDQKLIHLVAQMLARLPETSGGWKSILRSELHRLGYEAGSSK